MQITGLNRNTGATFPVTVTVNVGHVGVLSVEIGEWAGEGLPAARIDVTLDLSKAPNHDGPVTVTLDASTYVSERPSPFRASEYATYDSWADVEKVIDLRPINRVSTYDAPIRMDLLVNIDEQTN